MIFNESKKQKKCNQVSLANKQLGKVVVTSLIVASTLFATVIPSSYAGKKDGKISTGTDPMVTELGWVKKAYSFTVPSHTAEGIKEQINKEIDAKLKKEYGERVFEKMFSNDQKNLEKNRAQVLAELNNGITHNGNTTYEGEIWYRQEKSFHDEMMAAKKGASVTANTKYYLNKDEVPYGGYFFPDNLGGIARRFDNGSNKDELIGSHTMYEEEYNKELSRLIKVALSPLKRSSEEKEKILKLCHEFNESRKVEGKRALFSFQCIKKYMKDEIREAAIKNVKARLADMSEEQLDKSLSPTEKLDIYLGQYDFPVTQFEMNYKGKNRFAKKIPLVSTLAITRYWEGRCNADRACGLVNRNSEPVSNIRTSIDEIGKYLNFKPLDVKALIMATYFYAEPSCFAMLGHRTTQKRVENPESPNMASFDIMLRTLFQNHKVPFVIDNHNNHTVNNVTVIGFDRQILSDKKLEGKEKEEYDKIAAAAKARIGDSLKNYNESAGADSMQNPKMMFEKVNKATRVVTVRTTLRLLKEYVKDHMKLMDENGPNRETRERIANADPKKDKFVMDNILEYKLYLTDDNEIVESSEILNKNDKRGRSLFSKGDKQFGSLDFAWFIAGKGDQENRMKCDRFLKFDLLKKLMDASSQCTNNPSNYFEREKLSDEVIAKIKETMAFEANLPDKVKLKVGDKEEMVDIEGARDGDTSEAGKALQSYLQGLLSAKK